MWGVEICPFPLLWPLAYTTACRPTTVKAVITQCCKDDDQSQRERPKFDPPPPLNPLTDRQQNLHSSLRRGYLPSCKISPQSDKAFRFYACAISRIKLFTQLFVFLGGGSSNRLQPRRPHGFWRKIRQKTRFRARMCLLVVAKLFTSFAPKTAILGPFRRDKFSLENAFNIGHVLSKRPLIVIVAP